MTETTTLTVAEVAKYLNCSTRTVRSMVYSGRLRALRLGKALRIPQDALDALQVEPEPQVA